MNVKDIKNLSATKINNFLQCGLKFKYIYFSDVKVEVTSKFLIFGRVIHKILEILDRRLIDEGRAPNEEDYDYAIKKYMYLCVEQGLDDQELINTGKFMLNNKLNIFNPSEKVISLEKFFPERGEKFKVNGVPVSGAIDKIVELDKNTLEVRDYKTNKFAMTSREALHDIQISMYDAVTRILYPDYDTIILTWDYLRQGMSPLRIIKTAEQRSTFLEYLKALYDKMLRTKEDDLKPRINKFCGWCDYNKMCPAYEEFLEKMASVEMLPPEAMNEDEFVEEWRRVKGWGTLLKGRKDELREYAYSKTKETNMDIKGKDYIVYPSQSSRTFYSARDLFEVIPIDDFVDLASLNKKMLDNYVENHPEFVDVVKESARVYYTEPSFRIKKNVRGGKS